jgi:hypothetical protein
VAHLASHFSSTILSRSSNTASARFSRSVHDSSILFNRSSHSCIDPLVFSDNDNSGSGIFASLELGLEGILVGLEVEADVAGRLGTAAATATSFSREG